jgi:uncharacterized membrane protein (UPF0136 family)
MNRGAFHGAGSFSRRQIRATHFCKIDMCIVGRACAERRFGLPIRHTRMLGPTKIYFIVFGVLTIAGGIVGYFKAGSVISIIAGSVTGILLLVSAWLLPEHLAAGLTIALITSLLLAAQFVPKFLRTGKAMPAGLMSILAAVGIVMAVLAWMRK